MDNRSERLRAVVARLRRSWDETPPKDKGGAEVSGQRRFERANRLCGDAASVTCSANGTVLEVEARGCSLCTASAALLRRAVANHDPADLRRMATAVVDTINSGDPFVEPLGDTDLQRDIDSLGALSENPARAGCARLPWEALADATEPSDVTTPIGARIDTGEGAS